MTILNNYIRVCNRLHNVTLPKLKFRNIDKHYREIYHKRYNIDEDDVNKTTFTIFIFTFFFPFVISLLFKLNFAITCLISLLVSLYISYEFNSYLYKRIFRIELRLNAVLHFIKINFTMIKETLSKDSDFILAFIKLIKDFRLSISKDFEKILITIHEGKNPERELERILSPSAEFNEYMKHILNNPHSNENLILDSDYNMLENRFKIYLHQIETRMSLVFFIGIFFPLGLCFLIMFYKILILISVFFIPVFYLLINNLFKKLIKNDTFLFGIINSFSKSEKKKFYEFIYFMKNFAYCLQENVSPESAFRNAYSTIEYHLECLQSPLKNQVASLLNLSNTFENMIGNLKKQMKSVRYYLILDIVKEIVTINAFNSSKMIFSILKIVSQHQKLEKKLETIMKGEKFKVYIFLFLLPIIISTIGGMFPVFTVIINNLNLEEMIVSQNPFTYLFSFEFIIIYSTLLTCVLISSYFFLKTINSSRINEISVLIFILFSILFIISFYNSIYFL